MLIRVWYCTVAIVVINNYLYGTGNKRKFVIGNILLTVTILWQLGISSSVGGCVVFFINSLHFALELQNTRSLARLCCISSNSVHRNEQKDEQKRKEKNPTFFFLFFYFRLFNICSFRFETCTYARWIE